jgi:hypothetical protein
VSIGCRCARWSAPPLSRQRMATHNLGSGSPSCRMRKTGRAASTASHAGGRDSRGALRRSAGQ